MEAKKQKEAEEAAPDVGLLLSRGVPRKLLGNDLERQALRQAARQEAERWGWAGATDQLRGYYRKVLEQQLAIAA